MVVEWVVLALVAIAVGVVGVAVARWQILRSIRSYRIPLPYDVRERITTDDGVPIELRRLPGAGSGVPVLLVHGVAANHRNIDFHPDNSLARHLAAAGRDVWLLTLRSGTRGRTWSQTRQVSFESMVDHDLPRGVSEVLRRTGHDSLDYVGFSMGGMLLYAALGRTLPAAHVRRAVIIGSPGIVRPPFAAGLVRLLPVPWLPTLRLDLSATLASAFAEWVHTPLHRLLYDPTMAAPGAARSALVDMIVDIPGRLSLDFARWATGDGQIRLADGSLALEGLRPLSTPVRFYAGAGDLLAPPDAVGAAYEAWAADDPTADKDFRVLGRHTGAAGDYGHGDLALGRDLATDLYDHVTHFLSDP